MSILKQRPGPGTPDSYDVIRIRNAVFYAYHGVMQDEQNLGGKFELDVDLYGDYSAAAERDALTKAVDYEQAYACIRSTVLEKKYYLIEALAQVIARRLLEEFPAVACITVRIRKPHPPVRGVVDYVEAEITRHR